MMIYNNILTMSNTYPVDEFIYFEHISKMYILEYNPAVV